MVHSILHMAQVHIFMIHYRLQRLFSQRWQSFRSQLNVHIYMIKEITLIYIFCVLVQLVDNQIPSFLVNVNEGEKQISGKWEIILTLEVAK